MPKIILSPLPDLDTFKNYNRLTYLTPSRDMNQQYFADLRRVCEVEDSITEWFDFNYITASSLSDHILRHPDLTLFSTQFTLDLVEVGGIDFSVWRLHLTALPPPSTTTPCLSSSCCSCPSSSSSSTASSKCYQYYPELSMGVRIVNKKAPLVNEVKRKGFLIDRGRDVEVREGDEMVVYISMGGYEK